MSIRCDRLAPTLPRPDCKDCPARACPKPMLHLQPLPIHPRASEKRKFPPARKVQAAPRTQHFPKIGAAVGGERETLRVLRAEAPVRQSTIHMSRLDVFAASLTKHEETATTLFVQRAAPRTESAAPLQVLVRAEVQGAEQFPRSKEEGKFSLELLRAP